MMKLAILLLTCATACAAQLAPATDTGEEPPSPPPVSEPQAPPSQGHDQPDATPDALPAQGEASGDAGTPVVNDAAPAQREASSADGGTVPDAREGGALDGGDAGNDGATVDADAAIPLLCQLPDNVATRRLIALVQAAYPPCPVEREQWCGGVWDPSVGQVRTFPVECRCGLVTYAWIPSGGEQLASVIPEFSCPTACPVGQLCPTR